MRFHSVIEEAGENSLSAQHDAGAFRCAVKSAVKDGQRPGLYCLLADFGEGDTSSHGGQHTFAMLVRDRRDSWV